MRICQNCGKANQVTRKYCIRCGKAMVSPSKPSSTESSQPEPEPAPQRTPSPDPEAEEPSSQPASEESDTSSSVTSGDQWVRPSEVARNRVRHGRAARKSELDKAKEAFAKGDQALVDDDRPGIVETRMLRASEVHELMKEPQNVTPPEPQSRAQRPASTQPEASAEDEIEWEAKAAAHEEEIERQILGSESAFVKKQEKAAQPETIAEEEPQPVPRKISSEFQSSRYTQENAEAATQSMDATKLDKMSLDEAGDFEAQAPPAQRDVSEMETEYVASCPECGKVFGVDRFTYPDEVYSQMGEARLKQARFFVVQGRDDKAQEILRMSRSLFEKAGDEEGLKQVEKLVDSLVGMA